MSRAREQAFQNLRLDLSFFRAALLNGGAADGQNYDLYLMEKGVMPLLMQGLDALARHVSKINTGNNFGGGANIPFNPLVWLAQFLLRNHPKHVKDHRTPIYKQFAELASIEHGRRNLLKRKDEIKKVWYETAPSSKMTAKELPKLVRHLDDFWGLEGAFVAGMPQDFTKFSTLGSDKLGWFDFWPWFAYHVSANDVVREGAFSDAERWRKQAREEAEAAEEEEARRVELVRERTKQRQVLEYQFDHLISDMYISDEITAILNKGVVIQGAEEREGGVSLQGDHIQLLLRMLKLWGCPVSEYVEEGDVAPVNVWGEAALQAWTRWLDSQGLWKGGAPKVDSTSVRILLSKESFQAHLELVYPLASLGAADDDGVVYAGAGEDVDEESGQVMRLPVTAAQMEAIQGQLNAGATVFAQLNAQATVVGILAGE